MQRAGRTPLRSLPFRGFPSAVCLVCLLLAASGAAGAQTLSTPPGGARSTAAGATSSGASAPRPASSGAQPGAARETGPAEQVIVTATRRASAINRVPVSVSAFTQATMDLKGARTIADVVRFTPGTSFDPTTNNVSIRGISSEAGAGTTGLYIDDTPVQMRNLGFNAENSLPDLFDLARVEVLRGPQGTLFGAGSEGGTVRYITPQPGLETTSVYGRAQVAASPYGSRSYEAGLGSGPLTRLGAM